MTTTKFKIGKYGLKEDPRGAHVVLTIKDRTYLGEVIGASRNDNIGCTVLQVRHFCGDMWPFEPVVTAVDVLVREYERAE